MILETYSHKGAEQLINSNIKNDLIRVLSTTNFEIKEGCGDKLRMTILERLKNLGWSDEFKLDVQSKITLTSSNDNHVLCFQTGNMSRFYADMLKLQYVYQGKKALSAFYILPSKQAAKTIGSNIAHFDRLTAELRLFENIVTIPTLVIGIC